MNYKLLVNPNKKKTFKFKILSHQLLKLDLGTSFSKTVLKIFIPSKKIIRNVVSYFRKFEDIDIL